MIGMLSIILAGVLIILGFFMTVLVKTVFRVVHNKQITKQQILGFAIPLALLDAIYCLYLLIKIGLLHSSKALAAIFPLQCILAFLVIVALPTSLLIILHRYRSRVIPALLLGVYAVLLLSSLSWYTPGMRSSIIDDTGRPLKRVYVFYHKPRYFLFSNWHTYTFTRTDEKGRFAIPPDFQFQFPFEYWVPFAKRVQWSIRHLTIYDPGLHNLAVVYDADTGRLMDNPHRLAVTKVKVSPEPVITLHDMTADPEDRYDLLFYFFYRTSFAELKGTEKDLKELLSDLKAEYLLFAAEYGNTMREARSTDSGSVGAEKREQRHPWIFYLQSPINGKTMEQRMGEIAEIISKRYLLR